MRVDLQLGERDSSPEVGGSILVANSLPSPPLQPPVTPKTPTASKTPGPLRRRGTVACRRCRRLRTKCVHGPDCQAPCDACRSSGPEAAAECSFPTRGEKDVDRDFRRRPAAQRLSVSSSSSSREASGRDSMFSPAHALPTGTSLPVDQPVPRGTLSSSTASASSSSHGSSSLSNANLYTHPAHVGLGRKHSTPAVMPRPAVFFPPHEEIVAGCRLFVSSYFQLGFLPKAIFIESITRNLNSVSPFLLSCILSISARFTPCLVRRYGGSLRATENFLHIARAMVGTEMYKPSLERTQGFFLLAISEWGNGEKDRSSMDMALAVRMASILKLHREETYSLPLGAPLEQVIRAESARRTFWMIHSQENLQAGYSSPAPFPPEDVTARLPCDEHAFAFGIHPVPRSVLSGTVPARTEPNAAGSPHRCLFATVIQTHNHWGQVARRACRSDLKTSDGEPWEPESEYQVLTKELQAFEADLPERHKWSLWNLRGWREEQMHIAYLGIVMVLRVSNIVERRIYLDEILFSVNNPQNTISPRTKGAPENFWMNMSNELFSNVQELFEQIDAFFAMKSREEGFPAIIVFCVYICGSLASYLWRYPQLCPRVSGRAEEISLRCLQVLGELHKAWPTSTRWNQGLQQYAGPLAERSGSPSASSSGDCPPTPTAYKDAPDGNGLRHECEESAIDPRLTGSSLNKAPGAGSSTGSFWKVNEGGQSSHADAEAFPNELFEAEITSLLAGEPDFGWLDFERGGG